MWLFFSKYGAGMVSEAKQYNHNIMFEHDETIN